MIVECINCDHTMELDKTQMDTCNSLNKNPGYICIFL